MYYVVFVFGVDLVFGFGGGLIVSFDYFLLFDYFGVDKVVFEVGVDFVCCFGGFFVFVNCLGVDFFFIGGDEGNEFECFVFDFDELVKIVFFNVEVV